VEVQAILPTLRKKTSNIRQFLCKKKKGDMVYMPSMKNLIAESNLQEWRRVEIERCENSDKDVDDVEFKEHKSFLKVIDTVSIKSITDAIILELDWSKFETLFPADDPGHVRQTVVNHSNSFLGRISLFKRYYRTRDILPDETKIDVPMLRSIMETNINDYLKKLPIFTGITHSQLETLVQMCQYKVLPKDTIVVKEGEEGDAVYIILSGEIKVESKASARMIEMLKYRESNLSGSREIGGKQVDHLTSKKSFIGQKRLTVLGEVMQSGKRLLRLINEDEGSNLEEKVTVELARLGPGEYFGEMAAFVELPRSATCTTVSTVLLVSLSKHDFHNLYHAIFSDLMPVIDSQVKRHMLQNIFDSKSPFLNLEGKNDAINHIVERSNIEKWPPGHIVFKEGDKADKFYFVYHGALKVEKMFQGVLRKLSILYSGNYFGELAVMYNTPRAATITTTTDTVLLSIDAAYFSECFVDSPQLATEFLIRMKGTNIDIRSALKYGDTRTLFTKFLEKERSIDNLTFIDDSDKFRSEFSSMTAEESHQAANNLVQKYLSHSAPCAVNVSHDVYEYMKEVLSDPTKHSADMFTKPQLEVLKLMEFDVFARFKKTEEFASLLDRIRFYTELDLIT